jgi:hypothetical protein
MSSTLTRRGPSTLTMRGVLQGGLCHHHHGYQDQHPGNCVQQEAIDEGGIVVPNEGDEPHPADRRGNATYSE